MYFRLEPPRSYRYLEHVIVALAITDTMLNNHNKETILSRNYHKKYYSDKTTDPQIYAAPQLPLQCAKTIFHRLSAVHGIYSGPIWESLAVLSFGGLDICSSILPWRSPLPNWAGSLHRFRHPSLQQRAPSTHNLSSRQVFLKPTGQTKFSGGLGQVP